MAGLRGLPPVFWLLFAAAVVLAAYPYLRPARASLPPLGIGSEAAAPPSPPPPAVTVFFMASGAAEGSECVVRGTVRPAVFRP